MTKQAQPTKPADFLHTLIDTDTINRQARLSGFVQRVRQLQPLLFVIHVIFSMPIAKISIDGLRDSFIARTGIRLNRTSWRARFNEPLYKLLVWLLARLGRRAHQRRGQLHFKGPLKRFKDIVLVDSTFIQVHDGLAKVFKGTRKAKAAIKVHTQIRALTGELLSYCLTAGSAADCKSFGVGQKDKGCLFIFDKGYQSSSLWARVTRVGGSFITRLPASYRPIITRVNRTHRGRARGLRGKMLREELKRLQRQVLDVQCSFRVHIRGYGGKRGRYEEVEFRVVGLWNVEEDKYHLYVTNLPAKSFDAVLVGQGYRLRWEVELFYRLGKSGLGLSQLKHYRHAVRVKILALCALIRASVAMQACCEGRVSNRHVRLNMERWGRVWREQMSRWALAVLGLGLHWACTWETLTYLARDPNPQRKPLAEQFLESFQGVGSSVRDVLCP